MKRGLIILIIGLIAGGAAYGCVYFVCMAPSRALQESDRPELAWLKEEFKLTDAEFQQISDLHKGYLPQCAEMCRRVAVENERLQNLLRNQTNVTPEIEKTLGEIARLRAECQTKMLRHFFKVSQTMPPEEGRRYLEWVREKAFASDHEMAHTHDSAQTHIPENH